MWPTDSIINSLKEIVKDMKSQDIQLGLFGSYARNEQSPLSDIDIVLKGNIPLLLVYDGIEEKIQTFVNEKIGLRCDVVDYADLQNDYEDAKVLGLEEFTLKTTIDNEVIWLG